MEPVLPSEILNRSVRRQTDQSICYHCLERQHFHDGRIVNMQHMTAELLISFLQNVFIIRIPQITNFYENNPSITSSEL